MQSLPELCLLRFSGSMSHLSVPHRLPLLQVPQNPTCDDADGPGASIAPVPCTGALRPKPGQGNTDISSATTDTAKQDLCCEAVRALHGFRSVEPVNVKHANTTYLAAAAMQCAYAMLHAFKLLRLLMLRIRCWPAHAGHLVGAAGTALKLQCMPLLHQQSI
jgi:hypothetical protein